MTPTATAQAQSAVTLDALYALVREDLKAVDALILHRIQTDIPLIHELAKHIVMSGGKRIRPALVLTSAKACGYEGDKHIAVAAGIEFLHTATLLHDDVVDESKLRRGLSTANDVFGNKASILVGDFLLSQAFQIMVSTGSLQVLSILSDASAVISKGEVLQLMSEGEPETGIEHYLRVIESKTAALFGAACELGAVVAGTEKNEAPLRTFGINIGTAFQLMDDVLDYSANQQALGKTVGDDFREGKITLPVIIAYNAGTSDEQAFWKRTMGGDQQPGDFEAAVKLLQKHQAFAKTASLAQRYCQEASQTLQPFPASPAKAALLDIVDFCIRRTY